MQIRKVVKKKIINEGFIEPIFDEDGFCLECGNPSPNSEQYWCCSACQDAGKTLLGHFKCSLEENLCECKPKKIYTEMIRTHVRGSKGELYTYNY